MSTKNKFKNQFIVDNVSALNENDKLRIFKYMVNNMDIELSKFKENKNIGTCIDLNELNNNEIDILYDMVSTSIKRLQVIKN